MYTFYKKTLYLFMFLVSGLIYSQETLTKKIEQTYSMTNAGELQLNSKHGNISITGWDKNRIAITMDVKVSHKKKQNVTGLSNNFITVGAP